MSKQSEIKRLSDDELLQLVHSNGSLLSGPPSTEYKELAIRELIGRGYDQEKFSSETEKIKKRAEVSLEPSILITNFLWPTNKVFEYDLKRFRKDGFEKKSQQDMISRFFGFVFYVVLMIVIVLYLLLES